VLIFAGSTCEFLRDPRANFATGIGMRKNVNFIPKPKLVEWGGVNHIHSKYINIYIINVNTSMYRYSSHSMEMCRMRRFLAFLKNFFYSPLLRNLSFHHFPPTSLPSSLTSSCHLFLGLLLSLVVSKFIYNPFFLGGGFYILPFSVHLKTNVTYLTLLSLL
jgi:hypothetical protein